MPQGHLIIEQLVLNDRNRLEKGRPQRSPFFYVTRRFRFISVPPLAFLVRYRKDDDVAEPNAWCGPVGFDIVNEGNQSMSGGT
jgi:hypothetical protein